MTISLTEDFKTVDELRQDTEAILAQVRANKRPVSVTMNGKPAVVMLDVVIFERMLRTLNLVRLLGPGEEDLLAGRTQPLDEFMSEFCRANQIPSLSSKSSKGGRAGNSRRHRPGQAKRGSQVGS